MEMNPHPVSPPLFSSGLELANLVVNSDLLQLSWTEIDTLYTETSTHELQPLPASVSCRVCSQQSYGVVAFVTSPICTKPLLQEAGDLVSSETLRQENFTHFESLCSKGNPSFSIHRAAITLFANQFHDFLQLKSQLINSRTNLLSRDAPLIITGHSLGGSIASLFTLWLLDSINPKSKRLPLCITYGSPFVGDKGLQRAVSERSRWSSCFLHVAGSQDPLPSFFALPQNPQTSRFGLYKPFGTFLFCSKLGCTCVEDPDSILLIAKGLESTRNPFCDEELTVDYYRNIVENLKSMFIFRRNLQLGISVANSSRVGIVLQLEASGMKMTQRHDQDINIMMTELETRERLNKRNTMNPLRKLNEIKIRMTYLEWYKKDCKAKGTGYYDSYKNRWFTRDMDVAKHKKFLTNYWKNLVEEAERKPQKEKASIRPVWLYAGTNYRRMVEPLDVAQYYAAKGNRDYRTRGRYRHYMLLEQWLEQDKLKPAGNPINKRKNVSGNLTEDSCFWADVEEAIISCEFLNDPTRSLADKQFPLEHLSNFERYTMEQIKNSAVSPEIFLEQSSFMTWWKEYQRTMGPFYNSPLVEFFKNGGHKLYANGCFTEQERVELNMET